MKKFFRWIIIIGATLMPRAVSHACSGEGEEEDFRFWLFQPDLVNMMGLLPFTYSSNYYYTPNDPYNRFGDDKPDTSYYEANVEEWHNAIGKRVDKKSIHRVLYQLEPDAFFAPAAHQEPFVQALQQPDLSEFGQYLHFSKQCEKGMNNLSLWSDEHQKHLVPIKNALLTGTNLLQTAQKPFVRLRTAYQLMKLSQYVGDTAASIKYYDNYIKNSKSSSWIESSALFYYATTFKDPVQRNYWLSKAFEWSIEKRKRAVQLFDFDELTQTLKLARSPHEKAVIELMATLEKEDKELPALERIYAADPTNKDFNILIEREINKIENWLYTNALTYSEREYFSEDSAGSDKTKNLRNDFAYLKQLKQFIEKIVEEGKQTDKAFLYLSLAHLSFIEQDYEQTERFIKKAQQQKSQYAPIRIQLEITKVLNLVARKINPASEQAIVDLMSFLEKEQPHILDFASLKGQLMRWLSEHFISKGETAKGILLASKHHLKIGFVNSAYNNFYHKLLEIGTPKDYETVLNLLNSKGKTAFEAFLLSEPKSYEYYPPDEKQAQKWDISKIKDYYALYYLTQDDLPRAYEILKTIPADFWEKDPYSTYLSGNPFDVGIPMEGAALMRDSLTKFYNKATFVQKLMELRQNAEQNKENQDLSYFLLGNAYYNMTQNGKSWLMSRIWSSNYPDCIHAQNRPKNSFQAMAALHPNPASKINWWWIGGVIALLSALIWQKMFKIAVGVAVLAGGGVLFSNKLGLTHSVVPTAYMSLPSQDDSFFDCSRAKAWYLKAMQSNHPNIATAACYMAGVCEENNQIYQTDCKNLLSGNYEEDENRPVFKNPYLEGLQKHFGGKFPQKSMYSCKAYQSFLEKL